MPVLPRRFPPRAALLATGALATLVGAPLAAADCPTNIRELPATGFLASAARTATAEAGHVPPDAPLPALTAQLGVAGGVRADATDVYGTAGIGGEVLARGKGMTGCASADVLDVRDGSARVTASGQVPLLFTGLTIGGAIDRDVRLPLSARPELLAAPVSRIAATIGLAFLDFGLTERDNHLRVLAVPFTVEQAITTQTADAATLDRHTTRIDTGMFRFVASDPGGSGELGFFLFEADWNEPRDMPAAPNTPVGFVRISPLALESDRTRWSFELDGGVLSLAGDVDCEQVACNRGFYVGALRHAWRLFSVEGRVERAAFLDATYAPVLEDRASVSGAFADAEVGRQIATTAFVARTQAWLDGLAANRAGVRVGFSQRLSHGFSAVVDGELASGPGTPVAAMASAPSAAARLLVSLAWQTTATR